MSEVRQKTGGKEAGVRSARGCAVAPTGIAASPATRSVLRRRSTHRKPARRR